MNRVMRERASAVLVDYRFREKRPVTKGATRTGLNRPFVLSSTQSGRSPLQCTTNP